MRLLHRVAAAALAVVVCAPFSANASQVTTPQQRAALMTPIMAAINAANAGNFKVFHAQYAASSTLVDEFAPYEWTGPNAQDRYFADFGKTLTDLKMTQTKLALGVPTYAYADGARGYVVVPAKVTANIAGKPYVESGWMAVTLRRSGGGWKIAVQCWTKGPENFQPY